MASKTTTVGTIDDEVLAYTAGKDILLDRNLVREDCIGSAAHATMLSRMPVKPAIITATQARQIIRALKDIIAQHEAGKFKISASDQDVHLAVERSLTKSLGDLGKKIHTGRSRNDQVALDLRLFAKTRLFDLIANTAELAEVMNQLGRKHAKVPMVGRTHMQKAMPSSVGLWATGFTEALLDDIELLKTAYVLNNRCPLGAAAGYGVPLPIDRQLCSDLLGFAEPIHNVTHAVNARGKMESIILTACGQVMLTLSRLAQDLMLYTMPEFGYFTLPAAFCTGSSIMPNKRNPDVMELLRARASVVQAHAQMNLSILNGAPTGYNRDLQETKEPFMEGLAITAASVRITARCLADTQVNKQALRDGFSPDVFATDRAIELVGEGMPFRDAYHHVKAHLDELGEIDPVQAIAKKTHLGTTAGLDFTAYTRQTRAVNAWASKERQAYDRMIARLLG
ncbi:MAG: argininosuccinate lyase [Kiritimatiellia bacterium]|jgi:argininosuccinate lyase